MAHGRGNNTAALAFLILTPHSFPKPTAQPTWFGVYLGFVACCPLEKDDRTLATKESKKLTL